jgi:hypothetical protein
MLDPLMKVGRRMNECACSHPWKCRKVLCKDRIWPKTSHDFISLSMLKRSHGKLNSYQTTWRYIPREHSLWSGFISRSLNLYEDVSRMGLCINNYTERLKGPASEKFHFSLQVRFEYGAITKYWIKSRADIDVWKAWTLPACYMR